MVKATPTKSESVTIVEPYLLTLEKSVVQFALNMCVESVVKKGILPENV